MIGWIRRRSSGRQVLVLLAMVAVFGLMILPWAGARFAAYSGGGQPLDLNFGFSPEFAFQLIDALGPDGRTFALIIELTMDVVWPIVYALFLSTLLAWLFSKGFPPTSPLQRLIVVPFLAMAADYAENVGIIAMLLVYPARLDAIAQITSSMQVLKWSLAALSLLLVAIGAAAALVNRRDASTR
ncbi:MAG: hypothetical protein U0556_15480 [Dehalococcoidia bacterium]